MVEIREAPVALNGWDVHPSGIEVLVCIPPNLFGDFVRVSQRPLRVEFSNGQTIIVRAKS